MKTHPLALICAVAALGSGGCSPLSRDMIQPSMENLTAMRQYHPASAKVLPKPDIGLEGNCRIELYYLCAAELNRGVFVKGAQIGEVERMLMAHIYGVALDLYVASFIAQSANPGSVEVFIGNEPVHLLDIESGGSHTFTNGPEFADRRSRYAHDTATVFTKPLKFARGFEPPPDAQATWMVIRPTPAFERDVYRNGGLCGSYAVFRTSQDAKAAKATALR